VCAVPGGVCHRRARSGDGCGHNLVRSQANQAPFSPPVAWRTGLTALPSRLAPPSSRRDHERDGRVGLLGFIVSIGLASPVRVGEVWLFADARNMGETRIWLWAPRPVAG
jgi:hypothetical protein